MKLSGYLQAFVRRGNADLPRPTRLTFVQAAKRLLAYFGDVPVEQITDRGIRQFEDWLHANFSAATTKVTLDVARRALAEYCVEPELTEAEVRRVVELTPDPELKGLVVLLAFYGVRLEDALRLSRSNLSARRLAYRCRKTGRKCSIPLAANHAALLLDLAEVRPGRLFPGLRANRSTLRAKLLKAATDAGLAIRVRGLAALRRFFLKWIGASKPKD